MVVGDHRRLLCDCERNFEEKCVYKEEGGVGSMYGSLFETYAEDVRCVGNSVEV